jgi:hypothetical protein
MNVSRKLWLTLLVACAWLAGSAGLRAADNQLSEAEAKAGWLLLFDGKTFNCWMTSESKPSRRPVEGGCLNPHLCGHYMMVVGSKT